MLANRKDDPIDAVLPRVRAELQRQELPQGARLRPIRELAKDYGVSYLTLRGAMLRLQEEGLVHVRHGAGVFVGPAPEGTDDALELPARGQAEQSGVLRPLVLLPDWSCAYGHAEVHRLLSGFLSTACARDWRVEVMPCPSHECWRKGLPEALLEREPEAIAWLWPRHMHAVGMARLHDRGIPIVSCMRPFEDVPVHCVTPDFHDMAVQVLQRLKKDGCERVEYLTFPWEGDHADPYAAAVMSAFLSASREVGAPWSHERIVTTVNHQRMEADLSSAVQRNGAADAYILMSQRMWPALHAMASEAESADKALVAVDLMHHYAPLEQVDVKNVMRLCVCNPFEEMGAAMAMKLGDAHEGNMDSAPSDLRVCLKVYGDNSGHRRN